MKLKQTLLKKWWLVSAFLLLGTIILILLALSAPQYDHRELAITPAGTQTVSASELPLIMAEGIVIPSQSASLHFPSGGIIEEVLVSEGEFVSSGQVIARQKGQVHLQAAVNNAELQLLAAQQQYDELMKQAPLQSSQAKLALIRAQKTYDDVLKNRNDAAFSKGDANHIDMAYAAYLLALNDYEAAQKEYEAHENLPPEDEERAQKTALLEQARSRHDQALAVWNYALSTADQEESNELDAYLAMASADVHTAQIDWQKSESGANIDDKALAEACLQSAKAAFEQALAAQEDLLMKAPFDGVIAGSQLRVGEYAGPDSRAVELGNMQWLIETTDLNELDIDRIYVGMPASISLDALPGTDLTGQVRSIEKAGINSGADVYYTVTIDLHENDVPMYWNMTAFIRFEPLPTGS